MRRDGLALAVVLGTFALCLSAGAQQPVAPPATQPSADDPDEIICRETPPPTGTRLGGGRECHTKREWDQRQKGDSQAVQGAELRGLQGNPGGR